MLQTLRRFFGHTESMKPSFVIIGLGNPGKQYEKTRHNVGFMAVELLRGEMKGVDWTPRQKFLCEMSEAETENGVTAFVQPTTFMNRSGECIRKIVDFYKLDPSRDILVIVDDIDLPLGEHRLRMSGGPGTHNGLKSIVDSFGENFPRLRIGIGPKPEGVDLANWVLSKLTKSEEDALDVVSKKILGVVKEVRKHS